MRYIPGLLVRVVLGFHWGGGRIKELGLLGDVQLDVLYIYTLEDRRLRIISKNLKLGSLRNNVQFYACFIRKCGFCILLCGLCVGLTDGRLMHGIFWSFVNLLKFECFPVVLFFALYEVYEWATIKCYTRASQQAASGQNPAPRPFLVGPLKYLETHRSMVFIWPSDMYLWTGFGPLWPTIEISWEPLCYTIPIHIQVICLLVCLFVF